MTKLIDMVEALVRFAVQNRIARTTTDGTMVGIGRWFKMGNSANNCDMSIYSLCFWSSWQRLRDAK